MLACEDRNVCVCRLCMPVVHATHAKLLPRLYLLFARDSRLETPSTISFSRLTVSNRAICACGVWGVAIMLHTLCWSNVRDARTRAMPHTSLRFSMNSCALKLCGGFFGRVKPFAVDTRHCITRAAPYLLRGLGNTEFEQVLLQLLHLAVNFGGRQTPVGLCVCLLCHHDHCLPPCMHRAAGGGHMTHWCCCSQHNCYVGKVRVVVGCCGVCYDEIFREKKLSLTTGASQIFLLLPPTHIIYALLLGHATIRNI